LIKKIQLQNGGSAKQRLDESDSEEEKESSRVKADFNLEKSRCKETLVAVEQMQKEVNMNVNDIFEIHFDEIVPAIEKVQLFIDTDRKFEAGAEM
jgi:hypothetical protein